MKVAVVLCLVFPLGASANQVWVDLQGSVSGGWPSALSGETITVRADVENQTSGDAGSAIFSSLDPGNWPTPNERAGNVQGTVGDNIEVAVIGADNATKEMTGSDGGKYAAYVSGNSVVTHTMTTGTNTVAVNITIKVKQEQASGTDPNPADGDTNSDGDVDWFDLNTVSDNYGTSSGASWSDGDFDGDGDVDFADWLTVQAGYTPWQ